MPLRIHCEVVRRVHPGAQQAEGEKLWSRLVGVLDQASASEPPREPKRNRAISSSDQPGDVWASPVLGQRWARQIAAEGTMLVDALRVTTLQVRAAGGMGRGIDGSGRMTLLPVVWGVACAPLASFPSDVEM